METMIAARRLTRRFGPITAVDGIDLAIRPGEVFGLLGPNGAGKTTTIAMLATTLPPSDGTATVNGHDIRRAAARVRQSIGIVFQEPSLDTILTGYENLQLHGRLYGVPAAELPGRIRAMLDLVGLSARAHSLARTYSGGMKRRLEIARGLLHRPAVLFLDEPTLGLDPATRGYIWDYLRALVRDHGTTVILTTHYMEEADALCDRIGIIDHGRIIALDTPEKLKQLPGGDTVTFAPQGELAADPAALPGVTAVAAGARGELRLTVDSAAQRLPALLAALGPLARIEVRTPSLEDVFIRLTGHDLRDNREAGAGFADSMFRQNNR